MVVTARSIKTLEGQQLALVDAWINAAAHPLKHQPGFKHVFIIAPPGTPDTVIIQFVWDEHA